MSNATTWLSYDKLRLKFEVGVDSVMYPPCVILMIGSANTGDHAVRLSEADLDNHIANLVAMKEFVDKGKVLLASVKLRK